MNTAHWTWLWLVKGHFYTFPGDGSASRSGLALLKTDVCDPAGNSLICEKTRLIGSISQEKPSNKTGNNLIKNHYMLDGKYDK